MLHLWVLFLSSFWPNRPKHFEQQIGELYIHASEVVGISPRNLDSSLWVTQEALLFFEIRVDRKGWAAPRWRNSFLDDAWTPAPPFAFVSLLAWRSAFTIKATATVSVWSLWEKPGDLGINNGEKNEPGGSWIDYWISCFSFITFPSDRMVSVSYYTFFQSLSYKNVCSCCFSSIFLLFIYLVNIFQSYAIQRVNRQEGQGSPNGGKRLQVPDIFSSLKQQEETNQQYFFFSIQI